MHAVSTFKVHFPFEVGLQMWVGEAVVLLATDYLIKSPAVLDLALWQNLHFVLQELPAVIHGD